MKKLLKSVLVAAAAATVTFSAAPAAEAMTQQEKDTVIATLQATGMFNAYMIYLFEQNLIVDGWHWDTVLTNDYGTLYKRADGKLKLNLKGSANDIGYTHGYFLANEVKYTCSDEFVKELVGGLIGGNIPELQKVLDNPTLFNLILDAVATACSTMLIYATEEMRTEMRGIVTGAKDWCYYHSAESDQISYERIALANLGFDLACSVFYPFAVDSLAGNDAQIKKLQDSVHSCDSFVVNKNGTTTGGTMLGRNFMNSDIVFGNDHGVVFQIDPEYGTGFVAHSFAGSVGFPVAMNEYGIGMGMNMAPAKKTNVAATGMGCLLQTRWTMQYTNGMWPAVNSIATAVSRGTPWIYVVGNPNWGAIVEAGATSFFGGIGSGSDADHFQVRYTDTVIDGQTDPNNEKVGQWENDHRYAVGANHFVVARLIEGAESKAIPDSTMRYDFLNRMVEKSLANDALFSWDQAKSLINYQDWRTNGPDSIYANETLEIRPDGWHRPAHTYYWGAKQIRGSRTAMDLKNRIFAIKYGMFEDDWVTVEMRHDPSFEDKPWYMFWY